MLLDKNVIYDLQNTVVTQEVVEGETSLFEMWAFSHEYNILVIIQVKNVIYFIFITKYRLYLCLILYWT
jgi:hypothetical protein